MRRLTEALPLTMAEPLPEISREQADLLLRQLHAALGTPRAGERELAWQPTALPEKPRSFKLEPAKGVSGVKRQWCAA